MDAAKRRFSSERITKHYVISVGVVHVALLIWGAVIHGPGWDEVGHLAAGLSHWQTGCTDFYRVNPPLVRMLATAPLLIHESEVTFKVNNQYNLGRPEFDAGAELMRKHERGYLRMLRTARFSCLPFAVLALWIIWRWSLELFGPIAAAISVTVWAFSPLVLNNAHLMTPDIGAATLGCCACYSFRWWLLRGTTRLAFLSGCLLGIALLTKFTWVLLAGLWPVQWLLWRGTFSQLSVQVPTFKQACLLVIVSWFVVNLGFGFEGSFQRLEEYSFYCTALTGAEFHGEGEPPAGNRFAETFFGQIPVPLPRNVLLGIDRQKVDFEMRMPSYLRGEWRDHGWWYYYIYATVVKEPFPFLLLGLFALCCCFTISWSREHVAEAINVLAPGLMLFGFVSSQTGFNHHLRYVLPAFPFFVIAIGILGTQSVWRFRWLRQVTVGLTVWGVAVSLSASPHWHAYFNILVGGSRNGPLHLLDSNVDWGQDLLQLEQWVKDNPDRPLDGVQHALPINLGIQSLVDVTRRGVPQGFSQNTTETDRPIRPEHDTGPQPGRYAVSVKWIYDPKSGYAYFQELKPVDRIGWTTRIYELSDQDVQRIRERLEYRPLAKSG